MAQRLDQDCSFTAGLCRRNAMYVLNLAWTTHPDTRFDATGVRWLHSHIEATHLHLADDMAEEFVQLMGSFYGECLRETIGGDWSWSGDQLGLHLEPVGYTFPFRAVAKQLAHGTNASLVDAFSVAVEHIKTDAA